MAQKHKIHFTHQILLIPWFCRRGEEKGEGDRKREVTGASSARGDRTANVTVSKMPPTMDHIAKKRVRIYMLRSK